MIQNDPGYNLDIVGDEGKDGFQFLRSAIFYNTSDGKVYNNKSDFDTEKKGKIITFNVMSLKDLQVYFNKIDSDNERYPINNTTTYELQKTTVSDAIFNGTYHINSTFNQGNYYNQFAFVGRYRDVLKSFDKFINTFIKKEDQDKADEYANSEKIDDYEDIENHYLGICRRYGLQFTLNLKSSEINNSDDLKSNSNLKLKDYEFNSTAYRTEADENYEHNAETIWGYIEMLSLDGTDYSYEQGSPTRTMMCIESIQEWITNEASQIMNEDDEENDDDAAITHASIYTLLSANIREFLDDKSMVVTELLELDKVFSSVADTVETYQPYIKSVTNHWYRDLDFMVDGVYTPTSATRGSESQYDPSDLDIDFNKDKVPGTIWCQMNVQEGNTNIVQKGQPQIINDKPYHYMVKSWFTQGYFLLYDGTIKTAQEIQDAKEVLKATGYSFDNPLLISKSERESIGYENIYNGSSTVAIEKIKNQADIYNNILKENGLDVRLQKLNFQKNSALAAFSILESLHTEDSEYIYRELKEYLIELGYFTRADFEQIETGVLKWLIPNYTVYKDEWPDTEFEKSSIEYGSFIRSKTSIDSQREELNQTHIQSDDGDTTPLDYRETINLDTKIVNRPGNPDNPNQFGYYTTTTLENGVTYYNYKQAATAYATKPFSEGTMSSSACGVTSCAIFLSGYKFDEGPNPYTIAQYVKTTYPGGETSADNLSEALTKEYKVEVTRSNTLRDGMDTSKSNIKTALKDGKPVIVGTNTTSEGHYMCMIGLYNDEYVILSDPSFKAYYTVQSSINVLNEPVIQSGLCLSPYVVKLDDFMDTFMQDCAYIIPSEVPSAVKKSTKHQVVGFKEGLKVVMPENGIIEKIGDVNEENEDEETEEEQEEQEEQEETVNGETGDGEATTEEEKEKSLTYQERLDIARKHMTTNGKYIIVKFKTGNGINNYKMRIEGAEFGKSIEGSEELEELTEGQELNKGEQIGLTTTDNMKVILYDDKYAVIDDVENYFKLKKRNQNTSTNNIVRLFFAVYEGGGFDQEGCGPEIVGDIHDDGEFGVGICQWTIVGDNDYLTGFLQGIYDADPDFCADLQPFLSYTPQQYRDHHDDLKQVFSDLANADREYFLQLQVDYANKEKEDVVKNSRFKWILDRPDAVIGTLYSLVNYGPAYLDDIELDEGMDDEEIIKTICGYEYNLKFRGEYIYRGRSESQARAGIDILNGIIDGEEFARTGRMGKFAEYENGQNEGYLDGYT